MPGLMKKHSKAKGLRPGTIVFIGDKKLEKTQIRIIDYDEENLEEKRVDSVEECFPFKEKPTITWINIDGLHEVEIIEKIGQHFNIHPLILEDIANTGQRPKLDASGDCLFLSLNAVVDGYFSVLETLSERMEKVEDQLLEDPGPEDLESIHELKRELALMRKAVWPLREVIGSLDRTDSELVHDFTRAYLRDLYEHTVQVIDTVETFRDMASGLLDLYLSSVSNRMNEVMKVLTIIATIFIPLGFLAGIYGMNFDTSISPFNLPELGLRYGYILFWILVLLIGGGLFLFFKRKKWL
jgi:magnesium transporter